ncbi:TPA: LCP family protein [Bacillus cereus]|nr:LCP family protein [Bacillus cereus]HDR8329055.1 LCP family protein [Bacillus cereus]HDR8335809.1 LCP family protein [Bacillus cereus]
MEQRRYYTFDLISLLLGYEESASTWRAFLFVILCLKQYTKHQISILRFRNENNNSKGSDSVDEITRQTKRRSKRKKIWIFALIFLLSIVGVGTAYGANLYKKAENVANTAYKGLNRGEKSKKREGQVKPLQDNISILIMGVDENEKRKKSYGGAMRTDALLLATINKDDKSVKLLSIPRDTRVYIPFKEKRDKINHAHAYGGVDGTIETVEDFLDVPVDYYVKFNFESFVTIVDSLGGIDVDVPVTFTEQDSQDHQKAIHIEKGKRHLDGEEALALARTRKIDSDAMRGQRQQLVLEAIAKKALSFDSITKLSDVLEAVDGEIKTNISFSDMKDLSTNMLKSPLKMDKLQIKGEDERISGIYYYQPDKESVNETTEILQKHLGVTSKSEHKKI